jgi:hypothetical protein
MRRSALLVATCSMLAAGVAHAQAFDDVLERVAEHRKVTVEELMPDTRSNALGPMQEGVSCPFLDFDVINVNGQPLWAVEVDVEQSIDDGPTTTTTIFIPYLPARGRTRARVHCSENPHPYRQTTRTIGSAGLFKAYRLDLDPERTVMELLTDRVNGDNASGSWQSVAQTRQTLAAQALDLIAAADDDDDDDDDDDPDDDFAALASALLKLELGAHELGAWVGEHPARLAQALALAQRAGAAERAQFAAAAIAGSPLSEHGGDAVERLVKMQCSGGRTGAQTLWLAATKGEIPSEATTKTVLERCGPSPKELTAWLGRIESPESAAVALGGLPDELFALAMPLIMARKDGDQAMAAFFADFASSEREQPARSLLLAIPGNALGATLARLAMAQTEARTAAVVALLEALLKKLESVAPADRKDIMMGAIAVLLGGQSPLPEVRAAILAHAAWAEPELDDKVSEAMQGQAEAFKVFDDDALAAAFAAKKMSRLDYFLAVGRLAGGHAPCTGFFGEGEKGSIEACLAVMERELAPLAGTAWRKEAIDGVADDLGGLGQSALVAGGAQTAEAAAWASLRKLGADVGYLAQQHCSRAGFAGDDGDARLELDRAARIDPQAPCIAAVTKEMRSAGTRRVISTVIRSLILAGLVWLGVWIFRRRLRKERAGRKVASDAPTAGSTGLLARLAGPGLLQRINGGLGEAQATLARDERPQAQQAARLLAQLPALAGKALAELARDAARSDAGAVRSRLVQQASGALYLVAVPGHAGEPRALRRQQGFAEGWLAHMERLRASVRQSGVSTGPITALVVFLGADASQGTLLVSFHDDRWALVPLMLVDDRDRRAGVATHAHRAHFNLAAGLAGAAPEAP